MCTVECRACVYVGSLQGGYHVSCKLIKCSSYNYSPLYYSTYILLSTQWATLWLTELSVVLLQVSRLTFICTYAALYLHANTYLGGRIVKI